MAAKRKTRKTHHARHYRYYIRVGSELLRSGADGHKVWYKSLAKARKHAKELSRMEPTAIKVQRVHVS